MVSIYKDESFLPQLIKKSVSQMRSCEDWNLQTLAGVILEDPSPLQSLEWKFSTMLKIWEENTGKISDTLYVSDMEIMYTIQHLNELSHIDLCREIANIRSGSKSSYQIKGILDLLFLASGFPSRRMVGLGDYLWLFIHSMIVIPVETSLQLHELLHNQALCQNILCLKPVDYVYYGRINIIQYITIRGACTRDEATGSIKMSRIFLESPLLFHRGVSLYTVTLVSTTYLNTLRIEGWVTDTVVLQDVECSYGGVVIVDAKTVDIQDFAVTHAETALTLINVRDVNMHTNLGLDPEIPLRSCCISNCLLGISATVCFYDLICVYLCGI